MIALLFRDLRLIVEKGEGVWEQEKGRKIEEWALTPAGRLLDCVSFQRRK